ncbi:AF4 FMR2 family member 4 isoform X2 [Brachionus plicatilis]|uniref:AF4/FMR2 family member lilli n=1 Tax=Brachionus plicatilis TaxID=10195 RepID=A0A3M7R9Z3_BRAPC|nr:AF4 FMR2 family member 4 isoform X2 [Brachionus plicatilis]
MNLAPPEQASEVPSESDKKLVEKPRPRDKESPRDRSRDRSREKERSSSPKRSSSHYKDYKRSSVSSSSSRGSSDYKDKSSRDRDTKSSRSEPKAKSSSNKSKMDSDSKESRKESVSYKSTSNGQSVKRTSILNEDQDLSNTSKKQKLSSAEQSSTNSVKPVVKTQNVNKSPMVDKASRETDAKMLVAKQNAKLTSTEPKNSVKNSKIEKKSPAKFSKTFDFLNTTLEEQVLHQRGKQKKHEADHEKDKLKKTICYMEAVCYFSLCAISQYRLKKTSSSSSTSNKSSFDLLKDTYELLRYLNQMLVKPIDNEMFIKKFRVLSNWMEAFINRWLWLMSLKELNLIREPLKDHYSKQAISQMNQVNSLAQQPHTNSGTKTSPNEIPPPSPASSVGSSAGSSNSNNATQNNQNTQQSQSQESSSSSNLQPHQIGLSTQKIMAYSERYFKLTEYNMRSQNFWDMNEHQINDVKYLSDFRETIKQQIQRDLHIDSQVELFAAYILTGLELFKLNNF